MRKAAVGNFFVFWFNRAKTLPWLSEISASWSRSRVEEPCWISKAAKTKVLSPKHFQGCYSSGRVTINKSPWTFVRLNFELKPPDS